MAVTASRKYRAAGSFTVTIRPLQKPEIAPGVSLGRMALDKQFAGDLVAAGKGEMLTAMTDVAGSAAYVAIERVSGVLQRRRGSFVFQHNGTMTQGAQRCRSRWCPIPAWISSPASTAPCTINIVDSQHFYEFEYSLPAEPA